MLRSVRVTRVGDTDFLTCPSIGSRSIASWKREGDEPRRRARRRHPTPPRHHQSLTVNGQLHLGRVDHLRGLKENVIVGRLIPAGTGMPVYREVYLEKDEPVPVQPYLEDLLRAETDDDAEEALSLGFRRRAVGFTPFAST
jgi:hypothetical protein